MEGLGKKSRRGAGRPHAGVAASGIVNEARARAPPGTKVGPPPLPIPTFPRKFADVDWCSRKINPNKICAECWPGAAFGPYWLLTERLRYETTPLLPALRDRVHVHGRRDDAHGSQRPPSSRRKPTPRAAAQTRLKTAPTQMRQQIPQRTAPQHLPAPARPTPRTPTPQTPPPPAPPPQPARPPQPPPHPSEPAPTPRPPQSPPRHKPPTPTPPRQPKTASPSPSRGTTPPRAPRRPST